MGDHTADVTEGESIYPIEKMVQTVSYPYCSLENRMCKMPSDLPILEPLEGEVNVFDLINITGKPQWGTFKFTVQDNSKILLNHATDA